MKAALLAKPLDGPIGPRELVHYLFGRLIGDGSELAAPGQAYPILDWSRGFVSATDPISGEVEPKLRVSIKPRFAEGISFQQDRYGIWDGARFVEPGETG
jgi:hypothetical protein